MAYCVFWYPTIYQRKLVVLECYREGNGRLDQSKCFIKGEDIADDGIPFHLTIKFGEDENFSVKFEPKSMPSESFEIELNKVDENEDGFVLYEFDSTLVPPTHYGDFENVLRRNVYHNVKRFYHIHETNEERDRSLVAFISNTDNILKKSDNEALISFLAGFEEIFRSYAYEISERNKIIQQTDDCVDEIEDNLRKLQSLQQEKDVAFESEKEGQKAIKEAIQAMAIVGIEIANLSKFCSNALIEYTYYKTLAHSKNNISFCIENTQNDEYRRKALNIRNSIRYIENIKYVNQTRFNRFSAYRFEETIRLQAEVRESQEESKTLQEESKALQKQSKNSINHIHHTEKLNSVVTWFSVFLAVVFGLPMLVREFYSEEIFEWFYFMDAWIFIIGMVFFAGWFAYVSIRNKKRRG